VQFVPIPPGDLNVWSEHWLPFIPAIASSTKEPVEQLLPRIASGEVQLALVWDGRQAHALVGMRFHYRGKELVGEVIWLTGLRMKQWRHLLPELERYLKDYVGCKVIRPICRKGWSRQLLKAGYRTTHLMMEKVL